MEILCVIPLFPRNLKLISAPKTCTCLFLSVVKPKEWLSLAYSSLPMRISVNCRRLTIVAKILFFGKPGNLRS